VSPDDLRQFTPQPPGWTLDWDGLDETYGWIQRMRDCPQSPAYHAEGDVWIHTRMVLGELIQLPAWRALDPATRELLFAAATLHDVGKPATTRIEGGLITSRGHSVKGARMARRILWEMGIPPPVRESIAALIRYHQLPYYLIDRPDGRRLAIESSQTTRIDLLTILAEADVRGRICSDLPRLIENIGRFAEYSRSSGFWSRPYRFANEHSRFLYFRVPGADPVFVATDETDCEVTLMSGFPGAGKDTWLAANYPGPVISLDAIREQIGMPATGDQGNVLQRARLQAEERLAAHEDFAWNATNVSRELRGQVIELAAAYNARVRIVWLEAPRTELWERNRTRPTPVPESVIDLMMERWETPDPQEAHDVRWLW
jgi:putative nucleotidyltransferase with HDIG domain